MTEFVKISTLVLVQQQQLGSLLLSSRSTLRLAAVAVRLVIPLLYSLKRFDAEGPLLLRPMRVAMVGEHGHAVAQAKLAQARKGGNRPGDCLSLARCQRGASRWCRHHAWSTAIGQHRGGLEEEA